MKEVAELKNALRHVEDIVRGDVKSLSDVVESIQSGLSLSSGRIDDLFKNLKSTELASPQRESIEKTDSHLKKKSGSNDSLGKVDGIEEPPVKPSSPSTLFVSKPGLES